MKRRILTFLILVLAAVLVTDKNCAMAADYNTNKEYCVIEDCIEGNISRLQERLRECRFCQPQQNGVSFTRHGESNTFRRIHDNTKNGYTPGGQDIHIAPEYSIAVCHKAVATSRHTREYYIYALRHIII